MSISALILGHIASKKESMPAGGCVLCAVKYVGRGLMSRPGQLDSPGLSRIVRHGVSL